MSRKASLLKKLFRVDRTDTFPRKNFPILTSFNHANIVSRLKITSLFSMSNPVFSLSFSGKASPAPSPSFTGDIISQRSVHSFTGNASQKQSSLHSSEIERMTKRACINQERPEPPLSEAIIERLKTSGDFRATPFLVTDQRLAIITNKKVVLMGNEIAKNPFLKRLDIRRLNFEGNKISAEGAKVLVTIETLRELCLRNNSLSDEGAKIFAHSSVTVLDLENNGITDEGVRPFSENVTLETFHVGRNQIGNKGAKELAKMRLKRLFLDQNCIGSDGAIALSRARNLQILDLRKNQIQISSSLLEAFAKMQNLSTLFLSGNVFESTREYGKGLKVLSKSAHLKRLELAEMLVFEQESLVALASSQTLTHLDLSYLKEGSQFSYNPRSAFSNRFKADQGFITVRVIEATRNIALTSLSMCGNSLSDDFAKSISSNKTLLELKLSENKFTSKGAKLFASHPCLTALYLDGSEIGDDGATFLAHNKRFKTLSLQRCGIETKGAKALSLNHTISALDMSSNQIGKEGLGAFGENTSITRLNISAIFFDKAGILPFSRNTMLTQLIYHDNENAWFHKKKENREIEGALRAMIYRNQRLLCNWEKIVITLAFKRANRKNNLQDSILSLMPDITPFIGYKDDIEDDAS